MQHEVVGVFDRKRKALRHRDELQQLRAGRMRGRDAADGRPDGDDVVAEHPADERCVIDVAVLLTAVVQSTTALAADSSDGSPVVAQQRARPTRFADRQRAYVTSTDRRLVGRRDVERMCRRRGAVAGGLDRQQCVLRRG